ncbi:hypothetical protein NPIL_503611 [Nephila pilipes]|uniref:Uncharacterized protein n=1 Tax=Nephila pilipes TaxID=299642 RepID=A0A8X6TQJ1_NEPPI|nr:hypothetical protein NPIL_503611 [Nephila pilipes]
MEKYDKIRKKKKIFGAISEIAKNVRFILNDNILVKRVTSLHTNAHLTFVLHTIHSTEDENLKAWDAVYSHAYQVVRKQIHSSQLIGILRTSHWTADEDTSERVLCTSVTFIPDDLALVKCTEQDLKRTCLIDSIT